jgi:SAM-dependent methyltransferase
MSAAVLEHNRRAWDELARRAHPFTTPATDDQVRDPFSAVDALTWLEGRVAGKRVLCLAAGGGRQSALFAAAGAHVTVVDLSGAMLARDREVAIERKLDVRIVEGSMDDLGALEDAWFDFVVQPVSTCYVPDVVAVYRQVARVIAPGGIYLSQHKQPASLQAATTPSAQGYELVVPYYRSGPLPQVAGSPHREEGTLEFLHRWEELIGGLCRCGFVVLDLVEPLHAAAGAGRGDFGHRSTFVAPYVRIKARRVGSAAPAGRLWMPG